MNILPIGNQFGIGIAKKNSLTSVNMLLNGADTVKLDLNNEILVVMNYDVETGTSEVWVNPSASDLGAETAPAPGMILPDGNIIEIGEFTIRQDSEGETPTIVMDELRNGTSWASVTPTVAAVAVGNDWNFSTDEFVALSGDITSTITVSGLTLITTESAALTIGESASTIGDMTYTHRLKLNGSGKFDENNNPTERVLSFEVTGNTLIKVALTSANSSSDRLLDVAAGNPDNVIAQLPATGGVKDVQEYSYSGEATTIYLYSDDSGINLYQITTESVPTGITLINNDFDVKIYPNPVSNGYFTIQTKTNSEKNVKIFNIVGK